MPSRLAIDVRDVLGGAVADVTVRWSIEGPGAFALDVDTQTDSDGVARLIPELGELGGPYRVRARAPWAEEPRPEIVTFELVDARETALPKPPLQLVTVSAERGGPALVGTLGVGECADSAFSAFSLARNDSFVFPGCALVAGVGVGVADVPTLVVNLVGQPPRVGRLALATGALEDCGPLPLPAAEQACVATGIYDADPCGRSGRALVVFSCPTGESTTVTTAHTFDVATCDVTDRGAQGLAATAAARAVTRVGCLDVDNIPRNAVVAREDSRDLLFLEESPTLARRVRGVTQFYDFGQEGTSHVLLGLGSNGDRLRVVSFRTRSDPESDNLLADTAAAFDVPVRPLTGSVADLDGDGLVDLFGLARGGDAQTRSVLLCLGRGSTSPICALGFELRTEGRDLAVATDLDGDRVFDFLGADFAGGAWRIVSNSLVRGVR